jgi:7-cyano-7-deazaguanine synthase
MSKAVVLLSGGLDSATCLAMAQAEGLTCHALSFDYGQRHLLELDRARALAQSMAVVEHKIIRLDPKAFTGSALTDTSTAIPDAGPTAEDDIPVTYVPARNTIFLSYALGYAETLGARDIFIGVNAVDYSGYPDCRPAFIKAFEQLANLATKSGLAGDGFRIRTPLQDLSKAEIIRKGLELGVDYGLTLSCYQVDGQGRPCGRCDSCYFRALGFAQLGMSDPTVHKGI